MGGGGDKVGERDGVGMTSGGNKPGDVSHVDHHEGVDFVGDCADAFEVDDA